MPAIAIAAASFAAVGPSGAQAMPGASHRIVYGETAPPGSWPFIARFTNTDCGGSLIKPRWILSAGHCGFGVTGAIIGRHDLTVPVPGDQFNVVQTIVHPDLHTPGQGNLNHDYHLYKLDTPSTAPIVELAEPGDDPVGGEPVMAAGWGDDETGTNPTVLRQASMFSVSDANCAARYGDSFNADWMLCANGADPDPTTPDSNVPSVCLGDSGGPLTTINGAGTDVLVGVTSWGVVPCGKDPNPAVFSRVSAVRDWIAEETGRYAEINSDSLIFPATDVGQISTSRILAISSVGIEPLTIEGISTQGDFVVLDGGTCGAAPRVLPANSSCTVQVAMAPKLAGPLTGRLSVETNGEWDAVRTAALSGEGRTVAPRAETGAAAALGSTHATVAGSVNPGGTAATWWVEYGTTAALGSRTAGATVPAGSANVAVEQALSGLAPGATYHYRVVAENLPGSAGTGELRTLTTNPSFVSLTTKPKQPIGKAKKVKASCALALPGSCEVTASLSAATAKKLGLKAPTGERLALGSTTVSLAAPGPAAADVKLTGKARRAIRKSSKKVPVELHAVGTASGETPLSASASTVLKPAK